MEGEIFINFESNVFVYNYEDEAPRFWQANFATNQPNEAR